MKTQSDGPMRVSEALYLIRSMPGAQFQVPRDGYARKRAIALKLGAMHLGGHEGTLDDQQLADLDAYAALVDDLVEDGYLIAHERPIPLGRAGIADEDVYAYDVVYALREHVAFSAASNQRVDSAEDLLELIKEEGRFVYTTSFGRGEVAGFTSTIARYSGEDETQTERLLKFVTNLERSGLITVGVNPYIHEKASDRVRNAGGLPSTTFVLRAA